VEEFNRLIISSPCSLFPLFSHLALIERQLRGVERRWRRLQRRLCGMGSLQRFPDSNRCSGVTNLALLSERSRLLANKKVSSLRQPDLADSSCS